MDDTKRTYTNGEVTIIWNPALCVHSKKCIKCNPDVFRPKERPWIKPLNSTTDKIIEAVRQCPTGALTYFRNGKE